MRSQAVLFVALMVIAESAATPEPQTGNGLDRARAAALKEVPGGTLKTLLLRGKARVLQSVNGNPAMGPARDFELRVSLPASCLRIDNDGRRETRAGFSGSRLLNRVRSLSEDSTFGASYGPEQIDIERSRCAHLVLGIAGVLPPWIEGAQSKAETPAIQIAAPGFEAGLEVDQKTGLPAKVRYVASIRVPRPGDVMPPPPQRRQVTITFSDRRLVGGALLPHKITREAEDTVLEEISITSASVNAALPDDSFTLASGRPQD